MAKVSLFRPFTGLRPTPEKALEVAAPPYDVLNSKEARELAKGKEWSFLHISKAEIDLPEGTDVYSSEVYAKASENLTKMINNGILKKEEKPCYYVYRVTMGSHTQTGLVVGASVEDYNSNRIRKHEFTRVAKEDDRVNQIDTCNAQTGPVLLVYKQISEVDAIIKEAVKGKPEYTIPATNDITHTLWVISKDEWINTISESFDKQEAVYIADGHHRSAAASRIAAARKAASSNYTGNEAYNSFLAVAFPVNEMKILDYNRVVRDLNGLSIAEFMAKIEEDFTIEQESTQVHPTKQVEYGMYLDDKWYRLTAKKAISSDPVERLDVSVLSDRLLDRVLGIKDLRKDNRIDFIGGMRGLGELEKRVNSGEMAVAFAMRPTLMEDLIAVADAEKVMPPKSTWFEPKLADGVCSYPL